MKNAIDGTMSYKKQIQNRPPSRLNLSSAGGPYGPLEVMFL